MAKAKINKERCKGCLLCVSVCPKGHIIVDEKMNAKGFTPATVKSSDGCSGCALCAVMCPECCIEVSDE